MNILYICTTISTFA